MNKDTNSFHFVVILNELCCAMTVMCLLAVQNAKLDRRLHIYYNNYLVTYKYVFLYPNIFCLNHVHVQANNYITLVQLIMLRLTYCKRKSCSKANCQIVHTFQ